MEILPGFYTLKLAAQELGVEYKTLYARVRRGQVETTNFGSLLLIPEDEFKRVQTEIKFQKPAGNPPTERAIFRERHKRTYASWRSMMSRCYNPKATAYENHGGRGIIVCEEWHNFENFLSDMGERPPDKTLDRYPNNDGNYEPGNCRWATWSEQNKNKRPWGSVSGRRVGERSN
jgi:hypothetical protein